MVTDDGSLPYNGVCMNAKTLAALAAIGAAAALVLVWMFGFPATPAGPKPGLHYQPRAPLDISGYMIFMSELPPWSGDASLDEVAARWDKGGYRLIEQIDRELAAKPPSEEGLLLARYLKASLWNYEGDPSKGYEALKELRKDLERDDGAAEKWLFTIIYAQGVTSLRRGEDENCILCRGESSCIFPIVPSAVHTKPDGSRQAIHHFTEYLTQFPEDLEVRWLLNLAHMTLGEHPDKVDPKYVIRLDKFCKSEFDIGKFRDVGHLVGVNRLNMQGGGIMEDFDNDGLLDLVVTANDPTMPMAYYRNRGDGTFEDCTEKAGLGKLRGALYCVQGDYNNDGHMDIFVPRAAWHPHPVRPSLLRNNGDGTFTDVAKEAGLAEPINSISAAWMDYDNDGQLDLFVCCDRQPSRLYRNKGDGTFEDATAKAGLPGDMTFCKGVAWIDFDNDGYADLFLNFFPDPSARPVPGADPKRSRLARLFRNNRNGTFTEVTHEMGVDGPFMGFSCWAFDYDNDGWLDIFATSYYFSLAEIIKGLQGVPTDAPTCKLYRNRQGKGFDDVTKEAGLDQVYSTMGSNFADFDNDGYLDIYLGTGSPDLAMLVPNRMFKNVAGKRFADITVSSGTGHLQKGHSVACGDWRRTGNIDIFHQMGGVTMGDRYHNVLFQNPGQGNNSITLKLIGKKTNRAAIGARIKVATEGKPPLTIHRHVTSGSSFGANPLEQTIGVGKADRLSTIEITWPTSGTTQVFRDVAVGQSLEVTEFEEQYRVLPRKPIVVRE